jgi:hypothetical protein
MEFMLMFYETPEDFAPRDTAAAPAHTAAWTAYIGAMKSSGAMTGGNGLQPPHLATALRLRNGKRQVQDGPFAETREQLGGYVILNVDSLDAALEWAARAPCAATGGVEVRPVLQIAP